MAELPRQEAAGSAVTQVEAPDGLARVSVDQFESASTQTGTGSNCAFFPAGPLSGGESDGTRHMGAVWAFNMGAATSGQQRGKRFPFGGPRFGLIYRINTPPEIEIPTFAVKLNDAVYPVQRQAVYHRAQPQATLTATGGLSAILIDADLPDRGNTGEIVVTGNPDHNYRLSVYGFFLADSYYRDANPLLTTLAPVSVPVSPAEPLVVPREPEGLNSPASPAGLERRLTSVDHLLFTETAGDTGDVIILRNGLQIDRVEVKGKAGATWPRKATQYGLAMDAAYSVQVPAGGPSTIKMTVVGAH